MHRVVGFGIALACCVGPSAAPEDVLRESPRNASYRIEVRLDTATATLDGTQVLTWRNLQATPTDELWFHLYWNAWRNDKSTWLLEDRIRGRSDRGDRIGQDDWGWLRLEGARLLPADAEAGEGAGPIDLTERMRYASPDDGNPHDRTVLVVDLPEPVEPGETIRVAMTWEARVPRTFARTGRRGDYYFVAHWFPKLGVYEADGWNCHQFHSATEFFSDYGSYDVSITVPGTFVVGASGQLAERTDNADGTATHRYTEDDIHAFTWTASPTYVVREATFEEPGLPAVEMRLLLQPEHLGQMERHFAATRAALKYYGTWYGAYPYGHVTVVDPAYGSGAGGMEYPTLFTCGTRLFNPYGGDSPESVTIHEAGHQFWYGLVGNNEFEHAWLDEGLNTYSTLRTLEAAYGPRQLVARYLPTPGSGRGRARGFFAYRFDGIEVPRWQRRLDGLRADTIIDDPAIPTWRYHPGTAGTISYTKTALWLLTLERYLGWEVLQPALSEFFERSRYRHPTPEELFAILDETSGQDLGWFFDQVYRDSVGFDYAIESAISKRAEPKGYVERDGELVFVEPAEVDEADEADEATRYRSEVVVKRNGEGVFPVEVLLVFEDGHEERHPWDGAAHWTAFVAERPAKLDYAVVDPDRVLMLDTHVLNNSRVRDPDAELPARKWGSKWMLWLQDFLSAMAFFG